MTLVDYSFAWCGFGWVGIGVALWRITQAGCLVLRVGTPASLSLDLTGSRYLCS